MKRLFIMGLTAIALTTSAAPIQRIETFPISSVRLGDSQFQKNQQADIYYLLGLDADRLLAPYLKGAGLNPRPKTTPTGRIRVWTAISVVTMCRH